MTPYELLTVASMVEREAQVPADRAKIAAVIYNRLKAGMPLGIDASIYYAVELEKNLATYTHELTESQLRINSPYNTRTHTGLPPTPISNPGHGLDSGGRPPGTRRPTCTTWPAPTAAASRSSPTRRPPSKRTWPPTKRPSRRTAATRRSASTSEEARRPRLARRAQPLAGDAQRGARRARHERLALPAAAGSSGAARRDGARAARRRVPRRQRHDPPQGGRARARGRGERRRPRDRRGQHAHVRLGRQRSPPRTPTRPACSRRSACPSPGCARRCSGRGDQRRAVVWALLGAGAAEVCVWNRTSARAEALAEQLGARAVDAPQRADLLVNCTSVGLGLERSATEDCGLNQLGFAGRSDRRVLICRRSGLSLRIHPAACRRRSGRGSHGRRSRDPRRAGCAQLHPVDGA